jgi:hypothetical protein
MQIERVDFVDVPTRDIERAVAEFVGERDSGVCNMAFFDDPDGNSLILHRRYAP